MQLRDAETPVRFPAVCPLSDWPRKVRNCRDSKPVCGLAAAATSPGRHGPRHNPREVTVMLHRALLVLFLASLVGCTKPVPLPETPVRAASAEELAAFRAELGTRFGPEHLQAFDTALQELQLDAMNRDVATAAAREAAMRAAVHGKTVRAAEILGWQARRRRILGEIALLTPQLEHDLKRRAETAATGTPQIVLNRIQNVEDILARLRRDLAATEQRLADWGALAESAPVSTRK